MNQRLATIALCVLALSGPALSGEPAEPVTGILGAFGTEVKFLVAQLENGEERKIEGIPFWTGRLRGRRVAIARSGVGKVNAALTATLLHVHFRPAEVVFSGIAGAVNPDLKPGDLVIAERTAQHDYGTVTAKGLERKGARSPVTGERNPIFFPADPRLLKAALDAKQRVRFDPLDHGEGPHAPRVVQGIVVTGDTFIALPAKRDELRKELGADAVEMEGAAVAQVCYQWKVSCLVIRSISDLADEKATGDIRRFIEAAARNSALLVTELVAALAAPAPPAP
ncbi:MAG: 5'-methylthioadenosine/adenosylhomocysteine nucleosidase [Planctomycetes bacterium]|nr:5'-methylthioadenosine/adenosylhomocysteine nucleosidase [Planctomycetota bacterium]